MRAELTQVLTENYCLAFIFLKKTGILPCEPRVLPLKSATSVSLQCQFVLSSNEQNACP